MTFVRVLDPLGRLRSYYQPWGGCKALCNATSPHRLVPSITRSRILCPGKKTRQPPRKEYMYFTLINNVRPCVARRTPWRDKPTIWAFQVSPSQACKESVGKGLFHIYFSSQTPICNEDYRSVGYAVARSVAAINCRSICFPPAILRRTIYFRFSEP